MFYPPSPEDALRQEYVGKSIRDVPLPAAVLDLAALRRNCEGMLRTVRELGLGWRVHVKTHKTVEATRLQVGEDVSLPANLVVSTLAEGDFLLPLLKEWVARGRKVNVLYGLPIVSNAVPRLAEMIKAVGPGSVSILLDDPAQVPVAEDLARRSGAAVPAFIKVDMGGRRAGVVVTGDGDGGDARFVELASAALGAHRDGRVVLSGLYSHAGHSYGGDSRHAAVRMMRAEMEALLRGADELRGRAAREGGVEMPTLVLSGGASPTALSVQNLQEQDESGTTPELRAEVDGLSALFATVRERGHAVEIHAGVYPLLDLQQLAAHSMSASRLSWRDMAFTIMAEVHSVYPGRGSRFANTPEALIGAGGLALGREPCKAYEGWAVVTPWGRKGVGLPACDVEEYEGWMVGRFSQEHGILTWDTGRKSAPEGEEEAAEGPRREVDEVVVGQRVRLWPNHACIASSHFGWYFVVDEEGEGDEIVDVWVRARGW